MTLRQIAALTGRNYETVKSTVRRARVRGAQPVEGGRTGNVG
jgi:DNA-directed RNA polymerase specialized sigma24 family protein